jgi:hypothetical protein
MVSTERIPIVSLLHLKLSKKPHDEWPVRGVCVASDGVTNWSAGLKKWPYKSSRIANSRLVADWEAILRPALRIESRIGPEKSSRNCPTTEALRRAFPTSRAAIAVLPTQPRLASPLTSAPSCLHRPDVVREQ